MHIKCHEYEAERLVMHFAFTGDGMETHQVRHLPAVAQGIQMEMPMQVALARLSHTQAHRHGGLQAGLQKKRANMDTKTEHNLPSSPSVSMGSPGDPHVQKCKNKARPWCLKRACAAHFSKHVSALLENKKTCLRASSQVTIASLVPSLSLKRPRSPMEHFKERRDSEQVCALSFTLPSHLLERVREALHSDRDSSTAAAFSNIGPPPFVQLPIQKTSGKPLTTKMHVRESAPAVPFLRVARVHSQRKRKTEPQALLQVESKIHQAWLDRAATFWGFSSQQEV